MAAKWGREEEFKRLFQAQMKRMTRDGLDTLVYIAIKDMNEVSDGSGAVMCVQTMSSNVVEASQIRCSQIRCFIRNTCFEICTLL